MKHLTLFKNRVDFETAKLEIPNVSFDGEHIHYVNTPAGLEYVDLGLPSGLLWAACNVGATKPLEAGLYFAWGATEGCGSDPSDGKTFGFPSSYDSQKGYPLYISLPSTLDAAHDAATVNMGDEWRMPDKADLDELFSNCTNTLTTIDGVKGILFTSKINGNTLFFPMTGCRYGSDLVDPDFRGGVWSRSSNKGTSNAYFLQFSSSTCSVSNFYCDRGRSVRGVK